MLLPIATFVMVVVFACAVFDLAGAVSDRARLRELILADESTSGRTTWQRLNTRFRQTRIGTRVEQQLVLAGVDRPPLLVVTITAAVGVVASLALDKLLAPAFLIVGFLLAIQGLRIFLRRARDRRREAFIVQMPELARVLANATSAGLSIRTAIEMASEELSEPASTELSRVARTMQFGDTLETGLLGILNRLPSREIKVLVSTLLVSSRSGGSLVTSLRGIADTLEARKETRREVRTTLAQATLTGYMVAVMGILMLIMLNTLHPGTVQRMTTNPVGEVALVIAGLLYALGLFLIHKITRIEP
ncbi:type II secretion system F family protein [Leekyejoonella antrihumi]|uniref:type II secretion system F family protein n=1 Tax=Leekyejoonella antrihumi TaxID=1660198 RepID=UPI0016481216|nr:type II secretion system F family protein [Leekyejoonella antrihumi]